jgi:pSer/pThr/pTyr-binding forkhead associated (FHA) protein
VRCKVDIDRSSHNTANSKDSFGSIGDSSPADSAGEVDSILSLHLVDSGQVLHLAGRSEFTLGRVAEGQPILPDVDLSPYEAYAMGVSRLHVALKVTLSGVVITDLGSSNGTRVNGQKIVPHVDYPINHGDVVAVGKLKIQILVHQ